MTWPWGRLAVAAISPALLTPVLLWKLPTDFLPILLGDYLALHFLIYGLLTAVATVLIRPFGSMLVSMPTSFRALVAASLAVAAFNLMMFGLPIDRWLFSFWPVGSRWAVIAVVACGAIPFFVVDEILLSQSGRTGGYALTKLCFLVSLAIAIVLNPAKLFFLAIIIPAVLLLFLMFGTISRLCFLATRHPLPGAIGNAMFFAWAIGVTFPMVVR